MKERPNEPKVHDLVKHKITHVTGVVIAKYPESETNAAVKSQKGRNLLDIRLETGGGDRDIWYGSPAEYWEVINRKEQPL